MILALLIVALAIFLAGACAGILAALVVSIHRARRTPFLSATHERRSDSITRRALTGIRDDSEEGQ
jgi:hypothetical protein